MEKVEILLSTYCGANYVAQQLDSLLSQDFINILITIRDDGSRDNTMEIVEAYRLNNPERIRLHSDDAGNVGGSKSFLRMLEASCGDYVMFCDQDDVWLPNKVSSTLTKMKEMENLYGNEVPLLVFTDLVVVDSKLEIIAESFWGRQHLSPSIANNWKQLLAQNVVTGCTMMLNPPAVGIVPVTCDTQLFHDHIAAVAVSKNGKVSWLEMPTLLYRQHGSNVAGAVKFNFSYIANKLRRPHKTLRFMRMGSACFNNEVSVSQLLYYKFILNIKRLFS